MSIIERFESLSIKGNSFTSVGFIGVDWRPKSLFKQMKCLLSRCHISLFKQMKCLLSRCHIWSFDRSSPKKPKLTEALVANGTGMHARNEAKQAQGPGARNFLGLSASATYQGSPSVTAASKGHNSPQKFPTPVSEEPSTSQKITAPETTFGIQCQLPTAQPLPTGLTRALRELIRQLESY